MHAKIRKFSQSYKISLISLFVKKSSLVGSAPDFIYVNISTLVIEILPNNWLIFQMSFEYDIKNEGPYSYLM